MLYTSHNTGPRPAVTDVESRRRLDNVMTVDTSTGEVVRCCVPVRTNAAGDGVETYTERYRSIHAICGREHLPVLFHCYGRVG